MAFILLLIIFLVPSGGIILFYKIQQFTAQQQMRQLINKNEVETSSLHLTKVAFDKCKLNDHEILLQGKMYDIKSAVISDTAVDLLVVNDSKEDNILEKIRCVVKNRNNRNRRTPIQIYRILNLTFICPEHRDNFVPYAYCESNYAKYIFTIPDSAIKKIDAPPQLA